MTQQPDAPEPRPLLWADLLGAAPDITGGACTQCYMDRARDRDYDMSPEHAHCRTALDEDDTTAPEEPTWAGATELASDREIARVAATGVVGYRQNQGRLHHCLAHKPAPASRWADFHEVGADDLDDGGICVHPDCGRDLLAAWPTTRAPEEPTR